MKLFWLFSWAVVFTVEAAHALIEVNREDDLPGIRNLMKRV